MFFAQLIIGKSTFFVRNIIINWSSFEHKQITFSAVCRDFFFAASAKGSRVSLSDSLSLNAVHLNAVVMPRFCREILIMSFEFRLDSLLFSERKRSVHTLCIHFRLGYKFAI